MTIPVADSAALAAISEAAQAEELWPRFQKVVREISHDGWYPEVQPGPQGYTQPEVTALIVAVRKRSARLAAAMIIATETLAGVRTADARLEQQRKLLYRNALNSSRVSSRPSTEERKQLAQQIADEALAEATEMLTLSKRHYETARDTLEILVRDADAARKDVSNLSYLWQVGAR